MGNYASRSEMIQLGVNPNDIKPIYLDIVDDYINSELMLEEGFKTTEDQTDRLDVGDVNKDWVQTNYYPIIGTPTITDNMMGDTQTILTASEYDLDAASGIIKLKDGATFTKGYRSVQVEYEYGYSTVPGKVQRLASNIAAKMIALANEQVEAGSLEQERIGDYMYKINVGKNILARYSYIDNLMKGVYRQYAQVI